MPTPREQLAEQLAKSRIDAGYTSQGALATALHVSRPVVSKAETATAPIPSVPLLTAWSGVTGVALGKLTELAERCRSGTPSWFMSYKQAESEATTHRSFAPLIVPGLAQTEAYARAVISGDPVAPAVLAEMLRTRIERQQVLSQAFYVAIIAEEVLARDMAGPAAMAEQCEHLLALAELPNVTIYIVPAGANHGAWGACDMATREGHTTINHTTFTDDISTDSPDRCDRALRAFERVLGYAMSAADSIAHIRQQAEMWKSTI